MTTHVLALASDVKGGEAAAFLILAPFALLGAIGMVWARNAVHSALFLVMTMLCLGVFYVIESGPFIGIVQIIVYTGAIMMLFLFVLMLVGRDSSDSVVEVLRGQRLGVPERDFRKRCPIFELALPICRVGASDCGKRESRILAQRTPIMEEGRWELHATVLSLALEEVGDGNRAAIAVCGKIDLATGCNE